MHLTPALSSAHVKFDVEPDLSDGWSGKKKKTYNNIFCKGQNTTVSKYIMERVSVGSVFFFLRFSIITAELAIFKLILKSITQKEWWNAWTIYDRTALKQL